ncbi:Ig-like domain-containing protein [Rhizobium sp. TRM96647]|uniref:Ig-like domain-containing protein n=1 Tax=unclassified Rhizobium TaxID=2613769 RepID=UPI0021E808C7|nr:MULTISPECIES: Ig-like domain-containing protein [unclassified Rhizobium]MCV3738041.1 Ig-like domain-containing protein [Rhizobium sp. TRM96647]MCV3759728.1 Ig-like domain-containing protein [Rhizobium sp. TRM96650]
MSHATGTIIHLDQSVPPRRAATAGDGHGRYIIVHPDDGATIAIHSYTADGQAQTFTLDAGIGVMQLWLVPRSDDPDAGFILVWHGLMNPTLYRQFLDANGAPIGDEPEILAWEEWANVETVAVGTLAGGGSVVAWMDWRGFNVQAYDAQGAPSGERTIYPDYFYEPCIVPDAEGGFSLIGIMYGGYSSNSILGLRLDPELRYQELTEITVTPAPPAMATLPDGGMIAGWISNGRLGIVFIDALALEETGTVTFEMSSSAIYSSLALAQMSDGDFVATWTQRGADGEPPVLAGLRINADGTLDGGIFEIDSRPGIVEHQPATITAVAGGDFFVTVHASEGGITTVHHIEVNYASDAPEGVDRTVALTEDGTYRFGRDDFALLDANNDDLTAIEITSLPDRGTLDLEGVAVTVGMRIEAADLVRLVYRPAPDGNGTAYAALGFRVIDSGASGAGGSSNVAALPNVITFDVAATADAPSGKNRTIAILEDGAHKFQVADFGFHDADGDAFSMLQVTSLPAGTLLLDGKKVVAGQKIDASQLSTLVYSPPANATGSASFTFQVIDDSGGIDAAPKTVRFDILAVNDAPSGTNRTISLLEDGRHPFKTADFGFSDKADGHALQAIRIAGSPSSGTLTLDGKAVKAGQTVAAADIAKLTYTPLANMNGTASFTFQVIDNGGTANGGRNIDPTPNQLSFRVTPVNDAPSGTNRSIALLEDGRHVFKAADFGFSDKADGHALQAVKFAGLPSSGALTLAGKAVKAGQTVAAADIAKLAYTPLANMSGTASLTFQVVDNGGTANGGRNIDPTPNRLRFDIAEVNDAPSGASRTIRIVEDKRYGFKLGDFGFSDKVDGDAFHAVKIASLAAGKLTLAGKAVKAGQVVGVADIGKLAFTPRADDFGKGFAALKFQVIDDGKTANGGRNIDPSPNTIKFDAADVTDVFRGTAKADKLKGTKGHDILDGRAGKDMLTGAAGPDTFIFKSGYGRDTIRDFDPSGSDRDRLDLSDLRSVKGFSDLKQNHMHVHGKDVWIDGGHGDVVILKGVKIADLSKSDFLF